MQDPASEGQYIFITRTPFLLRAGELLAARALRLHDKDSSTLHL